MVKQRDIDRWEKGKEHWNKWAEGRLANKAKLETEGKWAVDREGVATNAETKSWIKSATVDFSDFVFEDKADFNGFVFPHIAKFSYAEFKETAWFEGAAFSGNAGFYEAIFSGERAWFYQATFSEDAYFDRAEFFEDAMFGGAIFSGDAKFPGAIFWETAGFNQCAFDGSTVFDGAEFHADARFDSAKSDGLFSLDDVRFDHVPNFIQMSFRAPARLDDLQIKQARLFLIRGDKDKSARWRALKKLAMESRDHVREQTFFANEMRERRGIDDTLRSGAFWLGLVYEATSDFGRSILLPIAWLFGLWVVFTLVYISCHSLSAWLNCEPPGLLPMGAAGDLSFFNTLPFAGMSKAEQIGPISKCLYGVEALPRGIIRWTILQNVLSAAMIFLILLGIRNRFRIK